MTTDPTPEEGWPEKLAALIEALHNFIEIDKAMGRQLLAEGKIDNDDFTKGINEIKALERLVKRLEQLSPDATLDGTVT